MKKLISIFSGLLLLLSFPLFSQEKKEQYEESIEDNSYFIEESYNQEPGVVQHYINGLHYAKPSKDFFFSFTQEWPLAGIAHQISYSIPYTFIAGNTINGIGDIFINYRYQLLYHDDWAACSPRFSIILPTGNSDKGLGNGVMGFQTNLPLSKRLSNQFITHFNAGMTFIPNVKGRDELNNEIKRTLTFYNIGASFIWLIHRKFNFLLEYLTNFISEINDKGEVERSTEIIISPGIRAAIEVEKMDLEIVPGFAVPFSFGRDLNRSGIYLYLSFEHSF
jgi:hypothetical protein